jgi:L-ascorbate metabolism protein UlaG (beta-lactamase superfamily)
MANKKSDHFDGTHFHNIAPVVPKSLLGVIKWQLQGSRKKWPDWVENQAKAEPRAAASEEEVVATFINHATYLLQFQKTNILIDPVFSQRTSPLQWLGPKRVRAPGLLLKDLPRIDLILITHNHYDHMDIPALKELHQKFQAPIVTPLGNASILRNEKIHDVEEFDWWESYQNDELKVTLTPAQHWSARGVSDRFKALWCGFYIETAKRKIFWAGDTGYGPHFIEIQKKLGTPDLSFLPIGAYEPRWFMKDMHMNPEDAVRAHLDLKTPLSIGMHFGTFQLTDEALEDPEKALEEAKKKYRVRNFITLKEGETRALVK